MGYLERVTARKILLCDDSDLVRALVVHALQSNGYDIATIDDPKHLAGQLAKGIPDLVLVDATFPGTSEDRLVELVAPHTKDAIIHVFSDRPEAETRALADRMGAAGTIPKDDVSKLPGRLATLFSQPR
jgi:DNA-binding response OmpR family regulator